MMYRAMMLSFVAGMCVLSGCCGSHRLCRLPESETIPIHRAVSVTSGPQIFPENWLKPPFNIKAEPIDPAQVRRAAELITHEIAKYPTDLVTRTLGDVYLLGGLQIFDNMQYGGTASSQDVYLVVKTPDTGCTDDWLAGTFHREYSTLLLNCYLKHFDQTAWNAVHPSTFEYLGGNSWDGKQGPEGGAMAIEQNKSRLSSAADQLEHGFLAEYSTSSIENDFNEYAAALFADPLRLWELAEHYPNVMKKARLVIKFYQSLDPTLNEQYFRTLKKS